jgi:hypothetical protein
MHLRAEREATYYNIQLLQFISNRQINKLIIMPSQALRDATYIIGRDKHGALVKDRQSGRLLNSFRRIEKKNLPSLVILDSEGKRIGF